MISTRSSSTTIRHNPFFPSLNNPKQLHGFHLIPHPLPHPKSISRRLRNPIHKHTLLSKTLFFPTLQQVTPMSPTRTIIPSIPHRLFPRPQKHTYQLLLLVFHLCPTHPLHCDLITTLTPFLAQISPPSHLRLRNIHQLFSSKTSKNTFRVRSI